MILCRFRAPSGAISAGLSLDGETVLDLSSCGVASLADVLEGDDPVRRLEELAGQAGNSGRIADAKLLAPVERQEIWAAGVTYLRSREARTAESRHDASAYDRVYEADRPELFFKSLPEKVMGPGDSIGVRRESRWTVPEPELTLVMNSRGRVVGCTLGNDVSARDIEGENLLYLPQAKVYNRSCALGPWILVGCSEAQARGWTIRLDILRDGRSVVRAECPVANLRRSFDHLAGALFRSQSFPHGAMLLTGTGVVPPDDFSLRAGDVVRIEAEGLGLLENPVIEV